MRLNTAKMDESVIHLCNLSRDDPYLGRPKPAKLLYYADAAKIGDYNPALPGNGCYRIIPNRPANSATLTQSEKEILAEQVQRFAACEHDGVCPARASPAGHGRRKADGLLAARHRRRAAERKPNTAHCR